MTVAVKEYPPYPLASVDNALLLLHLLREEEQVRVGEAAEYLGVSPSTAHRLLAMMVFRDFATQGDDRGYRAGPALSAAGPEHVPTRRLRQRMLPVMAELVELTGETVHLLTRVGSQVRFAASVECRQALRVGDRQGTLLPAHRTSGGLALLAELTDDDVRALYRGSDTDVDRLVAELRGVRRLRYAVNRERTERGLTAVGMAVPDQDGPATVALAIAMPTVRFVQQRVETWRRQLRDATRRAAAGPDLVAHNG